MLLRILSALFGRKDSIADDMFAMESEQYPEPKFSIHVTPDHPPAIPQRKTLFISAGHSETQPGAVGHGYIEAMIVLEFRDLVAGALRNRGVTFDKDGMRGQNLPLSDAIREAKAHDVAIEFHCNAAATATATGVETLSNPKHYPLCAKLNETVSKILGIRNRGEKPENSGQHSRLGFISTGGGIIHELFFISNADDLRRYKQNKQELAESIADILAREVR